MQSNFQETKIGKLPIDWLVVPIGKVIELSQYGLSVASSEDGTVPILGMKDLVDGKINLTDLARVSIDKQDIDKFCLQPNDILLNRTNSYELVGKVSIYESQETVVFASYLVRFQFDQTKIIPKFANYFLNSYTAQSYLKKIATRGVSQVNINPTAFRKMLPIPVPPIEEQKRIVEILEVWESAIALTEQLITAIQRQKQALLSKCFDENKGFYKKLGIIAKVQSGSTPSRADFEKYFQDGDIFWVKTMDLNNGFILETDESITKLAIEDTSCSIFPKESILVAMYGGFNQIGRTGLLKVEAAVNQAISAIQVDKDIALPEYILHYLNYRVRYWRRFAASSRKDPNITRKDVCDFPILILPIEDQQKIVDLLRTIDSQIQLLIQQKQLYLQQKQGLMQTLLTGQWRFPVEEGAA